MHRPHAPCLTRGAVASLLCVCVCAHRESSPAVAYPTVTLAAPAAFALGFAGGGAEAMGVELAAEVERRRRERVAPHVPLTPKLLSALRGYARRCGLIKCQVYAAVAASFAVACQAAAARNDATFFRQVGAVGYLVHFESLLVTRGDEWAMLQDTATAVAMLSRVSLVVTADAADAAVPTPKATAPTHGRSVGGGGARQAAASTTAWRASTSSVTVGGGRLQPVLSFHLRELGLRDVAHAAQLGIAVGCRVAVHATLATQGISDEQTFANLFGTNTAEQSQLNARCIERLAAYHERRSAHLLPPEAGGAGGGETTPRAPLGAAASPTRRQSSTYYAWYYVV